MLYGSDEFHLHIRTILVDFELLNPSAFEAYLFSSPTVSTIFEHAKRISCPSVWATQVELVVTLPCHCSTLKSSQQ